ncbi:MAG: LysR family transcriptional regulator [Bdellovibrionota bacterium]
MGLSTSQLEAFAAVAKAGNFSKAAKHLHITQSALSQRILNLENELKTALIIRDPTGLRLSSAGNELLRYCQIKESLETDVLKKISSSENEKSGIIRIAGFSSIMRSVIIPSLNELICSNPNIQIELFIREVRELPNMLTSNEVDFIITSQPKFRQEIESHDLGIEENVLVVGKINKDKNIFLDHDPEDPTTKEFIDINPSLQKKFRRRYLDEVYAILDGVKFGWGKAILPKHLIYKDHDLKTIKSFKSLKNPVYLQYFHQPYYSRLHQTVIKEICTKAPKLLKV